VKTTHRRLNRLGSASWLLGLLAFGACSPAAPTNPEESLGSTSSAVFANGDFESGAAGTPPQSWTVNRYLNPGITVQTPQTFASLNLAAGGVANTVELAAAGPLTQTDIALGAGASLRWPRYGKQAAIVNGQNAAATFTTGANRNVNELTQTMTVVAADTDPLDGQVHIRFAIAPVLENPAHTAAQQPYYFVQVTNVTKANAVLYTDFNLSGAGTTWQKVTVGGNELDYTDWQLVDVAPGASGIAIGDQIKLQFIAAGCQPSAHWGELYVDGVGSTIPGISVTGSAATQVNAGGNLTYTLVWRNGASAAETGVVVDFTTPPNTTFQGFTPPAGATCTAPAVGAAGTVTCTFTSAVAAGASGSLTVTVKVNAGTTGQIIETNYDIHSNQETKLLGNKVVTNVGCTLDAQCAAGNWCNESANACTPKLANGTTIPSDPPHTAPTLNGSCTAPAATLVCTSAVCDASDNKCGYVNGAGTCVAGTPAAVCRSNVCDPDLKCGYANGDGPCTIATGPTVCRSGVCSASGTCQPAGGCNVDADCTVGNWCNESAHTCTAKLGNGTALPSDPPHTSPTLNGACTAAAGTLVCTSSVCDAADNKCGYADGDGPCTTVTGPTVCRSATCSANLKCMPSGGCNVDGDCASGTWCNESSHVCAPKLANGTVMPTDAPHTAPTLNGTCTAAAATLVCASGACDTADNKCGLVNADGPCVAGAPAAVCRSNVCDPDLKCGYANGDGPCNDVNGATVCRSGSCSVAGTCQPAGGCNVDADCAAGNWCSESTHTCTAKLTNGTAMPTDAPHTAPTLNGKCTAAAATLVCASGVCDPADDKCGIANGDLTCTAATAATVCRSGACSTNGTCMPAGGCNVDADCTAGNWCKESTHACVAQLSNGAAMPTDAPHTSPTLDGKCATPAAALVCVSAVCDAADDKCGYANGDGSCTGATATKVCRSSTCGGDGKCGLANGEATCTVANAGTVCRSSVCDGADSKCGYANGDGPCTTANAATVCRSGACGASSGKCIAPSGGCAADADCTAGNWCNLSTLTCAPKVANGTAVPADPKHTMPTLDGKCAVAAATLTCVSGVCDTADDKCGYASGDGPCTTATAATVCRSGLCSASGKCIDSMTCLADADCAGAWCNIAAKKCAPKVDNGTGLPTDTGHVTPTVDGKCNTDAATLVCKSAACDTADDKCGLANGTTCVAGQDAKCRSAVCDATDSKCGYADGDGPCTTATAATVCRSGLCSASGKCMPTGACLADADCPATSWCNISAKKCAPKGDNGTSLPTDTGHVTPTVDGKCTTDAGALVCKTAACDPIDDKCGLANGTACTSGQDAKCRAGVCDADGKCGKLDGETCTGPTECRSSLCTDGTCGGGVDAGPGDTGPGDTGPSDASQVDAEVDAGPTVDSGTPTTDGTIEGGGCSTTGSGGSSNGLALGALVAFGTVATALRFRRQRRG
jgi:hypothetical protein